MEKQRRAKQLAREVLDTPERLRKLAAEGKLLEARRQWEMPRRLLESWKAKGVGGKDVTECLAEGDAAVGRTPVASPSVGTDSGRSSRDE